MWPIELAQEVPFDVSIDAIDISLAQFPPKLWLPENITLISHNVYHPFPTHKRGTYDLLPVQNRLCIWRDEMSDTLIKNLSALLSMRFHKGSHFRNWDISRLWMLTAFLSYCRAWWVPAIEPAELDAQRHHSCSSLSGVGQSNLRFIDVSKQATRKQQFQVRLNCHMLTLRVF